KKTETRRVLLQGGAGMAPRADNSVTVNPKLGVDRTGEIRKDKLLPEITALIAPDQYELITQPDAGIVAIQGTAGSGKTTIALHRVAWLHFRDPKRFSADRMMVMVFNKALASYISKVLPSLGVRNVEIDFFENWATKYRRRILQGRLPARYSEHTPVSVIRFKKHPALLKIIKNFIEEKKTNFEKRLNQILQARDCHNFPLQEINSMSLVSRSFTLYEWIEGKTKLQGKSFDFDAELRTALLRMLKDYAEPEVSKVETVIRYWDELFSDFVFLKNEFLKLTDSLTEAGLDDITKWLKNQYTQRHSEKEEKNPDLLDIVSGSGGTSQGGAALDYEDDPILLFFYQELFRDIPKSKNTKLSFSHLMIDEVQDFSPIELAVLLNIMDEPHTLTMAGDINQKMIEFSGFHDWESMFDNLGVKGQKISSLKIGYRSTFEIMDFSLSVLGNLASDKDFLATRRGPPVELFQLSGQGELILLLSKSLKDLLIAEPFASIAVICITPQDAAEYFSMLDRMEIPDLRLIADQDFPFTPGIDITDVKQVKGLEFDYVILLDVDKTNYPPDSYSRYLLHIAASRAAHQLWLMNYRESSSLLPGTLLDRIIR
ncbi:UvrD-helicase domain-containing protein, partial [bacterium]|nr:UvrD-helicase domain-containing protein [bacterium]